MRLLKTFISANNSHVCKNNAQLDGANMFYGNGLIRLTTESIGGRDVKVCQLIDEESGEKTNYLPVGGKNNYSKEYG